jgi:tetratricopeptide (TPR) repeat protein
VILSGKLAAEGGSTFASEASQGTVILSCDNRVRAHGNVDSKGNFNITLGAGGETAQPAGMAQSGMEQSGENWMACEIYAELPGYRSEHLQITQEPSPGENNVGIIQLHAVSSAERAANGQFTVSVNTLAVPDKARKEFDKGVQQVRKGKLQAARDYFKRAVEVYPRFAMAWLELGRIQAKQNSFAEAQQSFQEAVTGDPKLVDGYLELARVAAAQRNWQGLAQATDTLVQRWPDSSPEYWFLNAAAYYNLAKPQQAEYSVTRGLRLDPNHRLPQMEYLYGLVLADLKQYKAAADHVSLYLRLDPNCKDSALVHQNLAAFQEQAERSREQE